MRKVLWIVIALLAFATPSWAAYTTATIVGIDRDANNIVTGVVIEFTGAGEVARREIYRPSGLPSAQEVVNAQRWRDSRIAALNNIKDTSALPGLQIGQVIGAAPAPSTPTADELAAAAWVRKVAQLERVTASGVVPSGAFATAVTALKDGVNTDYNAANGALRTLMAAAL